MPHSASFSNTLPRTNVESVRCVLQSRGTKYSLPRIAFPAVSCVGSLQFRIAAFRAD
jgi:hypothetical protein